MNRIHNLARNLLFFKKKKVLMKNQQSKSNKNYRASIDTTPSSRRFKCQDRVYCRTECGGWYIGTVVDVDCFLDVENVDAVYYIVLDDGQYIFACTDSPEIVKEWNKNTCDLRFPIGTNVYVRLYSTETWEKAEVKTLLPHYTSNRHGKITRCPYMVTIDETKKDIRILYDNDDCIQARDDHNLIECAECGLLKRKMKLDKYSAKGYHYCSHTCKNIYWEKTRNDVLTRVMKKFFASKC